MDAPSPGRPAMGQLLPWCHPSCSMGQAAHQCCLSSCAATAPDRKLSNQFTSVPTCDLLTMYSRCRKHQATMRGARQLLVLPIFNDRL